MDLYGNPIYLGKKPSPLKDFTYMLNASTPAVEGRDYNSTYIYNSNNDTCLALLVSGTLTFKYGGAIDVFLVGGGGGGSISIAASSTLYSSGRNGSATSAFNISAPGGEGAFQSGRASGRGGNGGSGGGGARVPGNQDWDVVIGGSNGSDGVDYGLDSGLGQGTTTRAFHEETGNLFAGGGGAWGSYATRTLDYCFNGRGGEGGGGTQGGGTPNTGGGGGGDATASYSSGTRSCASAGGGGGYTRVGQIIVEKATEYAISIGAGGRGGIVTDWGSGGTGGSGIVLIRQHVE